MSETPPNTDEPKKEKESLKVVKDEAETTEETSTEEAEAEVSEEEKLIKELTEERDTFKEKYFISPLKWKMLVAALKERKKISLSLETKK